jgi:hypothetical protein
MVIFWLLLLFHASATVRYVNVNNSSPASPYTNWTTAATAIQDAVDVASPGDVIWVTDGTYSAGGRAVNGALTNRVAVDRPVVLQSVNGPQLTIIQGHGGTASPIRCVYLTNGAALSGFTLKSGGTLSSGDWEYERSGGGVLCESVSVVVSNCIITGNSAYTEGGGVYFGTLNNCTISGNSAQQGGGTALSDLNNCVLNGNSATWGGAALYGSLNNCSVSGNSARDPGGTRLGEGGGTYSAALTNCTLMNNYARVTGGGASWGSLIGCLVAGNSALQGGGAAVDLVENCTIVGNSAPSDGGVGGGLGGGVLGGTVVNSIIVQNTDTFGAPNYDEATLSYCCTAPDPGGTGNITDDPAFVDEAGGNYRLQFDSPCINSGTNAFVGSSVDLDGNPRIVDGTVDMGAYEHQKAPWIFVSPASQTVHVNTNIQLNVTVLGDHPLAYQWWFNGTPLADGGQIAGATNSSLAIANIQTNDSGSYQVVVTNDFGMATSSVATLTVILPVMFTSQPSNQLVLLNHATTFSVTAVGWEAPSYQWLQNGEQLAAGGRFSGTTSSNLTITSVQTNDSGSYQVVITNNYGANTSAVATLTVYAPAQIATQPASVAVLLGSNAVFSLTATGTAPGYQWYFNGSPISDGGRISGSATPTLSVSAVRNADAGGYNAVVTNLLSAAASRMAALTVLTSPTTSVRYVNLNNTGPSPPYLDWSTAATNIQDAIDAAVAGDTVVVSNGVYSVGGRAVYGLETNRVTIDHAVTVQSVNGPSSTTIKGDYTAPTHGGPNSRCAYLTNGAVLTGFTLTNGGTISSTNLFLEASGGAVWCESSSAIVSNCVLVGNTAARFGGGAFGGTLINCLLTNNFASQGGGACSNTLFNCTLTRNSTSFQNLNTGGGAIYSTLSNCLLVANNCVSGGGGGTAVSTLSSCVLSNNTANYGGGMCLGVVNNSLISSNRASVYGGGAYSNTLNNCVLKNNLAGRAGGGAYNSTVTNCTVVSNNAAGGGGVDGGVIANSIVYDNTTGGNILDSKAVFYTCSTPYIGSGGITNAPLFVNEAAGDFHLQTNSPCINAGNNAYVSVTNDLDGNPRIVGGTVDIGAYEFQSPVSQISYAWLQQYNLPINTNTDFSDADGDGMSNFQEWQAGTVPTNSLSVLRLSSPVLNGSGLVVTWQSVSNRTYFIERSINLSTPGSFLTLATNIAGQPGTTSFTDTCALGSGPFFYRVGIWTGAYQVRKAASLIPFTWLQQYNLPTDGTADFVDADGDGMNNWQEWIAGTDPTDPSSVLKMLVPASTNNPSGMVVSWQSVNTRTYYLQRSTDLTAQPAFSTIQSNIAGQAGSTSYTDTTATNGGPYFYRVGVQ